MRNNKNKKEIMYLAGLGLSFGMEIAVASVIGWWLGSKLDSKWNSTPYCSLAAVFIGFGLSVFHMLQVYARISNKKNGVKSSDES